MEERLETLLKKLNLTPAQFADEIGLKRSGIYHIVKGRNKPGMEFFVKVLERFPQINAEWLLLGKGEMQKGDQRQQKEQSLPPSPTSKLHTEIEFPEEKVRTKPGDQMKTVMDRKITTTDSIHKIVIFYKDGTFSEFLPR